MDTVTEKPDENRDRKENRHEMSLRCESPSPRVSHGD